MFLEKIIIRVYWISADWLRDLLCLDIRGMMVIVMQIPDLCLILLAPCCNCPWHHEGKKTLKENTGLVFPDIMGIDMFVHTSSILHNQRDIWTQQANIAQMEYQEERDKYNNYTEVKDLEEQGNYTLKEPKYRSGKGVEREFGDYLQAEGGIII